MKIKHIIILLIAFSFCMNFLLIAGHFNYAVIPQISKAITKEHDKLEKELLELTEILTETTNLHESIELFASEKNIDIHFELLDLYHDNTSPWKETSHYHATKIFQFEGELYIIKIRQDFIPKNIPALNAFILISLFFVMAISIFLFSVTNRAIVRPIEKLQRSIKNYKFGIKPAKAEGVSEADIIQNSFVELVETLEEEKEKQSRIIASISHDIKTPLTAILGYSDRVVNMPLEKERRMEYLDRIYHKALDLKELTEEFDDYLSCDIKSTLKMDAIKVGEFLKEIMDDYEDDLDDKNIKLLIDSNADDAMMSIDVVKIKRVFGNIISNSVRHINNFGKIMISVKNRSKYIEVTITDTGPGVPEPQLKQIFEPLFTSDPSRKISGLGLAICKDIIENHGGDIRAKNSSEDGLSIIFTIRKN